VGTGAVSSAGIVPESDSFQRTLPVLMSR